MARSYADGSLEIVGKRFNAFAAEQWLTADADGRDPASDRRHLAVLFCDLIGSTSLSAALDAAGVAEMAGMWRKSSATGSWRCSDTRSRRKTTPSAPFALRS